MNLARSRGTSGAGNREGDGLVSNHSGAGPPPSSARAGLTALRGNLPVAGRSVPRECRRAGADRQAVGLFREAGRSGPVREEI
jgi:hypothetical protein